MFKHLHVKCRFFGRSGPASPFPPLIERTTTQQACSSIVGTCTRVLLVVAGESEAHVLAAVAAFPQLHALLELGLEVPLDLLLDAVVDRRLRRWIEQLRRLLLDPQSAKGARRGGRTRQRSATGVQRSSTQWRLP